MEQRPLSAYAAELLGTFVLVFVVTMVVSLFVNSQGTGSDFAVAALAQGLVLFMLVATLARVSGAHFNPAITIGAAALRRITPPDAAMYIVLQLIGGILGAFMTKFLLIDSLADQANVGAATVNLSLLGSSAAGMVAEALGTALLVFAVVGIMMNPKGQTEWGPLVIGMTLAFLVMILGPLTGAAVNPARWFGPAIVAGEFDKFWVYLVGDIAGGVIGALSYWYLFVDRREEARPHSLTGENR